MREDDMLASVFSWAQWMEIRHPELHLLYHVPNERQVTPKQGAQENRKGRKRGVPDIQLDVARQGFHGLRIEMKTEKGTLSEEQKQWGENLKDQGFKWIVCRSVDSAIAEISNYLGIV